MSRYPTFSSFFSVIALAAFGSQGPRALADNSSQNLVCAMGVDVAGLGGQNGELYLAAAFVFGIKADGSLEPNGKIYSAVTPQTYQSPVTALKVSDPTTQQLHMAATLSIEGHNGTMDIVVSKSAFTQKFVLPANNAFVEVSTPAFSASAKAAIFNATAAGAEAPANTYDGACATVSAAETEALIAKVKALVPQPAPPPTTQP